MRLIFAVMEDLILFARDAIFGVFKKIGGNKSAQKPLLPPRERSPELTGDVILESERIEEEPEEPAPQTFRSTADILGSETNRPTKNTVMYTGSPSVNVFRVQAVEFDGVIGRLPYGVMVMVLENRGRWSRVAYQDLVGWVLRDDLADRSAYVYPDFTIGEANNAEDPNTLRLRAYINDEFNAAVCELPLQSSEYVLYRLERKGVTVPWKGERPRGEGTWHKILKGAPGVHIGIDPCRGCVMEYVREDGTGHLAYVDAVLSDNTVRISETNYPDQGIYNERVLTKEEWREIKPVFLDIAEPPAEKSLR